MAGLCLPLPTLRRRPRGRQRTARGRCGARNLHRRGLSPHAPRRSPGALQAFSKRFPRFLQGFSKESKEFQVARPQSPSRPGESHPEPLTDPDVRLSPHPARATQRRLAPSGETAEFLRSPVDPTNTVSDPPPSLHGHYPASSLLWGGPRLTGPSVLSASRVHRLCLFPWHGQPGSQVPYESPDESHYDCLWQAEARSKRGVSSCGVYLPDLDQPRPPDL